MDDENPPLEALEGINPEETLTKSDKNRKMQNGIRREMM
jgi:hypothetical protein